MSKKKRAITPKPVKPPASETQADQGIDEKPVAKVTRMPRRSFK